MRGGGFCARGGNTCLHKKNWFFLGDLFCDANKGISIGDVFEIAGDDLGIVVIREGLDNIDFINVGFVTDTDELTEADAVGVGHIENGSEQGAGLRHIAGGADGGQRAAKTCVELAGRNDEAEAVGADDSYSGLPCNLDDLLFELSAFLADFLETGGYYNHGFYADGGAFLHNSGDHLCRDDDDRQVRHLANCSKGRVTLKPLDLVGLRIDGIDCSGEAGFNHRMEDFVADFTFLA